MKFTARPELTSVPLLLAVVIAISVAAAPGLALARAQATYKSPQEAVDALADAVKTGSTAAIAAVLGPEGQALAVSGDPVADQKARERFEAAFDETHRLKPDGDRRAVLVIGKDDYPFPIPIVEGAGGWRFDTPAGREEILNRRVGENELAAIEVVRAYVDAQRAYAEVDHDGKGVQYARHLLSSDAKKDGLYWPAADGEPESPLGPLVANARAEGYRARAGAPPQPYHGYVFHILTAQGKDAPGGPRDYVLNGRMIGGFGLVAAPAAHGRSGIMTFIVNQDGDVYQKNLGRYSASIAANMKVFNPDPSWKKVSE